MVDDKVITGWALESKIEAAEDGSSCFVEATSEQVYKRRKRRKMSSNSDDHEVKAVDGSAFDRYVQRLSFAAFSNAPGECSPRKFSNIVLQQKPQLLNWHEGSIQNAFVTYPESDPTPVVKESLNNVERGDSQTHNSGQEPFHVLSSGLLKQAEGSTNSEMCGRALPNALNSEKFSKLHSLNLKNVDGINLKVNNGAYESSPMLYLKDTQQPPPPPPQHPQHIYQDFPPAAQAVARDFDRRLRRVEDLMMWTVGTLADLRRANGLPDAHLPPSPQYEDDDLAY